MIKIETGKVIWFNKREGFGLIHVDDGPNKPVHAADIDGGITLEAGQRIEFRMVRRHRNEVPVGIRVVDEQSQPGSFGHQLQTAYDHRQVQGQRRRISGEAVEAKNRSRYRSNPDQVELDELLGSK